jgi:hypothetical protein
MSGVPRRLIEHSLNVDPKATPKRQHLHRFADDRWDAIKKELAKLLAAGFIREVFHSEWLANPVHVHKKFVWTPEADQALAQLKDFLSKPPVLMTPRKKEQLLLYLVVTIHMVSTAIVVEW